MDAKSVIRRLMQQVEDEAATHKGSHVVSLRARVGESAGVEPAALKNAYADAVQNTPLQGVTLDVETIVSQARCEQCGYEFCFDQAHTQCSQCGSLRLALHGGDELFLDSVLIED